MCAKQQCDTGFKSGLVAKPFNKKMNWHKKDVSKLEKEVSIKIQENQMKQHEVADDIIIEVKETPVVRMEKSLLPKKEIQNKKAKGVRI